VPSNNIHSRTISSKSHCQSVIEITTKPDTPSIRKNLVIVDTTRGSSSSTVEEHLGFWIDEAAKTLVLADGTALAVRRFDDHWISAARGDMSYELDRQNGNLTYASSTTKGGSATITIGSGRCEIAAGPTR
jgi:hypothetical protein